MSALKRRKSSSAQLDKRTRIVQGAIACMIRLGATATQVSDIARETGIKHPLIHYYFPTLDELHREVYLAVLDDLKAETLEAISKHAEDPRKTLDAYVAVPFQWARKKRGIASLYVYFSYLSISSPSIRSLTEAVRKDGRDRISAMIYRGIEQGVFKLEKDLKVESASLMIQSLLLGSSLIEGTESQLNGPRVLASTLETVHSLLGIRSNPRSRQSFKKL